MQLKPLPFAKNALLPYISEETIDYHYGKHHSSYVTNLNNILTEKNIKETSLKALIDMSHGKTDLIGVYNNAGQIFNHDEFWNSMSTPSENEMPKIVQNEIEKSFGSVENFKEKFIQTGTTLFGSGWVWLVHNGSKLELIKSQNADTPFIVDAKPIITCDVWEHSYYIDYRNQRVKYLEDFVNYLINWNYAKLQLEKLI